MAKLNNKQAPGHVLCELKQPLFKQQQQQLKLHGQIIVFFFFFLQAQR